MNKIKELRYVIKDLKKIYKTAMKTNKLNTALQAQKVIAYVLSKSDNKDDISLNNLNKEQIEKLIKESEKNEN